MSGTLFAKACATGDLAAVEAGLAAGAGLGPVNPKGLTPLHLAAFASGSPEVVRRLVDAGADVNAQVTGRLSRFSAYADRERVGRIELNGPETPLHAAVRAVGHPLWRDGTAVVEIVRILLDAGANPNALGGLGLTPLTLLAYQRAARTPDTIRLLIAAGAELEAGATSPLFAVVACRNRPAVEALLAAGADPCRPVTGVAHVADGSTPLHMAVVMCDDVVFGMVLAVARDVNVADVNGATALHRAARVDGPGTVRRLLKAGADPGMRMTKPIEYFGRFADTPVEIARVFGLDRVVAVFEEFAR